MLPDDLQAEPLAIKRDVGNKSSIAFTLTSLGALLVIEGELDGARKAFEEALAIRTALAQKARVAASRLDLAARAGHRAVRRARYAPRRRRRTVATGVR